MPVGIDTLDWLAVLFAPGLTDRQRRWLVDAAPAASWSERLRGESSDVEAPIRAAIDLPRACAFAARDPQYRSMLAWLAADDQHLVTLDDDDYPALLRETADPPAALFVKGRRSLLSNPSLAVVGSRNPSAVGVRTAEAFARTFAQAGLTVISGLALGIDAAAHRGGLDGPGSTVAVVGTGLDIVYPAGNRALARAVAETGALVSEFPLGMRARASHFPRRNRILSGLALGCLVVEANLRSGSLITARLAAEQGREVFAIPGSIHSPLAKGCHALIRQGAKLTECAADVVEELGWTSRALSARCAGTFADSPEPLGQESETLLAAIGHDAVSTDTLVERLGWPAQRVTAALVGLELAGRIAPAGHGQFQRLVDAGSDFAGDSQAASRRALPARS